MTHICTTPYCGDREEVEPTDARLMAEGLASELAAALVSAIGNKEHTAEFVGILNCVIDARIKLNAEVVKVEKTYDELYNEAVSREAKRLGDFMDQEIVDSYIQDNAPAFIPLTETRPTTIRNGDRFNYGKQTMHVVFENEYIPGLRTLSFDRIEYATVKPGNPWDEKIKGPDGK